MEIIGNQRKSMPAARGILQKSWKFFPKSLKSFEVLWNSQKSMEFPRKSRKFPRDLENLLRDLTGRAQNLPARPKPSQSQHLKKSVSGPCHTVKNIFGGLCDFEVADSGCFWISPWSQLSSTEWSFWVPYFLPRCQKSPLPRIFFGRWFVFLYFFHEILTTRLYFEF